MRSCGFINKIVAPPYLFSPFRLRNLPHLHRHRLKLMIKLQITNLRRRKVYSKVTYNNTGEFTMLTIKRTAGLAVCVLALSSCGTYNPNGYTNYQTYTHYDGSQLYPPTYPTGQYYYEDRPVSQKQVFVPETYHVGESHTPVSHQDRDRTWVTSQNPQNYTIELANGDQAASVANTLYKAPKSERTAEVEYQLQGKPHYKGLYGSFSSQEAAQDALKSLPPEMQQTATIQNWQNVQQNISR